MNTRHTIDFCGTTPWELDPRNAGPVPLDEQPRLLSRSGPWHDLDMLHPKEPSPRSKGRPKGPEPPRKATTTYLRPADLDWMNAHLPRDKSNSEFIAEAVDDKIRKMFCR